MNQNDLRNAKATGETVGEVVIALVAIVHILKKQPGIDAALLDEDLRKLFSGTREDSISREIIKQCISIDKP